MLWDLFHFSSEKRIRQLQMVGDPKVIVNWFQGKNQLESLVLAAWQCRIRELQETFDSITVEHIYRCFS